MSGALPVAVVGAGPAGLTAALTLARAGRRMIVFEAGERVGGIARTETYKGYRFDIGGHRFFTKVPEVQALWEEWLGDEFLLRARASRASTTTGRFFDYPLRPAQRRLATSAPLESARIALELRAGAARADRPEESFEHWVTNRFGERLYRTFFKTYTEKVWGMPCTEIRAEWAAQRIQGLSLARAVSPCDLRRQRHHVADRGVPLPAARPGPDVGALHGAASRQAGGTGGAERSRRGHPSRARPGDLASSSSRNAADRARAGAAPSSRACRCRRSCATLTPSLPPAARDAAERLRYRDFLIVVLILNRQHVFPDNWIYVHAPERARRADPELQELEPGDGARRDADQPGHGVLLQRRTIRSGTQPDAS